MMTLCSEPGRSSKYTLACHQPTTGAIDSASAARALGQAEAGVPRVVINWANIRQSRARSSPAVGRLEPGDSVLVDSLQRGWYRVLMDGRPVRLPDPAGGVV